MIRRGTAASALGKAARFTQLDWVQRQLEAVLKIDPHPGTFNVRLVGPEPIDRTFRSL